ncbi:MAG: L,D-transpeptidase family protein, partial [Luteibaculum sp.]
MLRLLLVLLFSLYSIIGFANSSAEFIRRQIEQSHFKSLSAFNEQLHCVKSIQNFYLNRNFEPAWEDPNAVLQLKQALEKADLEGLNPNDYHLQSILENSKIVLASPQTQGELDLLLTDAYLLYVSHLLTGKVNPQSIDAEWFVSPLEGNPAMFLEKALSQTSVEQSIKEAMPKHEVYLGLRKALQKYRGLETGTWEIIPEGAVIKPQMEDSRLTTIANKLFLLGDLADKPTEISRYEGAIVDAVKAFQARHGLENEGNIGNQTIAALNVSPAERVDQIRVNLERWRWLAQEFGDYYIKVNIANFELEVVKSGEVVQKLKVIAGKPYRRTPVFSATMQYLVFNPTWTIPPGILNNDIIPGVKKDPNYLAKKKISVLDREGNALDASSVDWQSKEVRAYTYTQPPGPDNSLGAVKFMFPNSFHVYLHDTPSKELFQKTERALSSGCIRVQQPLSLAELVLNDPSWNKERIDKLIQSRVTTTVAIKEKPRVHLLYWTSWVDKDNKVHFR